MAHYSPDILIDFKKNHEFLVGLDSDGCVFDSMELKHKECFIPVIIRDWDLQAVSKYAREVAEFVNLYSKWRGVNRFPALLKMMELLRERPEVIKRKVPIPDLAPLAQFVDSGAPLGNPALEDAIQKTGNETLKRVMKWSKAVNTAIADMVRNLPPFPYVKESLDKVVKNADLIVVSQTPTEALVREWEDCGLSGYPQMIAGQEMGKKSEHLQIASAARYEPVKILMVGDAPGDLKAAKANSALFFPINPGHEEASWERFYSEGLDRFFDGKFSGAYQDNLLAEFDNYLPEHPAWSR